MPDSFKTALISGITGQDGSYLAELLLDKGYTVHGIIRRASNFNTQRIDHLLDKRLTLHYGDMLDPACLSAILYKVQPDEVYNLAAQSHVKVSFDQPVYTADTVAMGTLRLLEAIRSYRDRTGKEIRFYQAGSSEMFGRSAAPQSETTPFRPCSPYACAKVHAHWTVVNYREAYGLHASNGILFNHESPRRGETFVTRKITRAVTRIKLGLQKELRLGNLAAKRDWGFAGDYVRAMWLMLQAFEPDDYVIATGENASVADWVDWALEAAEIKSLVDYVTIDPRYVRPIEVEELRGNVTKARDCLHWQSTMNARALCHMMVEADLVLAKREKILLDSEISTM